MGGCGSGRLWLGMKTWKWRVRIADMVKNGEGRGFWLICFDAGSEVVFWYFTVL